MLAFDKNKVVAWNPTVFLAKNTAAPFAQLRGLGYMRGMRGMGMYDSPAGYDAQGLGMYDSPAGYDAQGLGHIGQGCSCGGACPECQPGLGYTDVTGALDIGTDDSPTYTDVTSAFTAIGSSSSILDGIAAGAAFVPGVGPLASSVLSIFNVALKNFATWLHIGAGRREADVIVPVQNQLMAQIGTITNGLQAGNASAYQLQQWYIEVWQLALAFMEFVLKPQFTDRRASGQALNTVMPYLDGTCGYAVPLGTVATPTSSGDVCGVNWNMLNSLSVAITQAGGYVPKIGSISAAAARGVQPGSVNIQTTPTGQAYMTVGTDFQGMIQQYAPYLLAGLAIMMFTRASK